MESVKSDVSSERPHVCPTDVQSFFSLAHFFTEYRAQCIKVRRYGAQMPKKHGVIAVWDWRGELCAYMTADMHSWKGRRKDLRRWWQK